MSLTAATKSVKALSSCLRNAQFVETLLRSPLDDGETATTPGDLIMGVVEAISDTYTHIENMYGRNVRLYAGDCVVGVLGTRRSSTNISGWCPETVSSGQELGLLSPSGILGVPDRQQTVSSVTRVKVEGVFCSSSGAPLNLLDAVSGREKIPPKLTLPPLFVVCGTSAECGKTTAMCSLIQALMRENAYASVSATKLCGTGRRRDCFEYLDAGAVSAQDFVDMGFATTYGMSGDAFAEIAQALITRSLSVADAAVAEIGGDITDKQAQRALREAADFSPVIVLLSNDPPGMINGLSICRNISPRHVFCGTIRQNTLTLSERTGEPCVDVRDLNSVRTRFVSAWHDSSLVRMRPHS